ncbi:unnamed protein product [Cochlearia groenlandica]
MEASVDKEQEKERRRRRKRTRTASRPSTIFLCGILIFARFGLSSSSSSLSPDNYHYKAYPSPRKGGPFHETVSFNHSPKATMSLTSQHQEEEEEEENRDDVYKEDKRLVRTGPNPLHN